MQTDGEADIGGGPRDFPSTCWSRFLGSAPSDERQRRAAMEELARHYWKAIYSYVRAKWAKTIEEAKDLTQDFFVWTMESDFLGRADPSRGKFRAFVKVALEHFLSNQERDRRAQKRGGDRKILALDGMWTETAGLEILDRAGRTPEEALDETWKNELLSRAERLLEEHLRREGKELQFRIFRDYYLDEADELDYQEVAARYGIGRPEVLQRLRQARESFRAIVTDLLAETVQGPDELREELRALFGERKA